MLFGSNNTKLQKELEEQRQILDQQGLELNQQRQKYEDLQKQLRDEIHTQKQIILTGKANLDTQVLTSKTRTSKVRTEVLLAVKEVEKKVDANQKKSEQGGKLLKVLKETQEKDMSDVNSRLDVAKKQLENIDAKITTLAVKIPDIVADIDEKAKAHVQRSQRSCVLDLTKKIESANKEQLENIATVLKKMQEKQSKMEELIRLNMKYSSKAIDQIENEKMMRRLGDEPKHKKRRTSKKVGGGCCPKCKKSSGVCSKRGQPGHLPLLEVDESEESSSSSESD